MHAQNLVVIREKCFSSLIIFNGTLPDQSFISSNVMRVIKNACLFKNMSASVEIALIIFSVSNFFLPMPNIKI